jgi:hypothetical protein
MGDLSAIFIVGFIVLGIYKIVELFVKRKERLIFFEKFFTHYANKEISDTVHLPDVSFGKQDNGRWTLRLSLLSIGIGLGCLLSGVTNYLDPRWSLMNFAYISIFGGLGLLASHLIEINQSKKK